MICKDCGEDKDLNNKNFIPSTQIISGYLSRCRVCTNLLRNSKSKKYKYNYVITLSDGTVKKHHINALNKPRAKTFLNMRYPGLVINKLYTNPRFSKNKT